MGISQVAAQSRTQAVSRLGILVPGVGLLCIGLLVWGWCVRSEVYLNAEFGLGYALGIVGTSMMLLLLVYSLRKRLGVMRTWGRIPRWLEVHMALGLLGPTAVLFHSNFELGSLNSSVALACVLLVSISGVVGRVIYPKIHRGLSGRRADVRELREAARAARGALGRLLDAKPELEREVAALEALSLGGGRGFLASSGRSWSLRRRARAIESRVSDPTALRGYTAALRSVADFRTYERLFALWHAFHLPFCIMLFTAAAVHVVAVHMY